MKSIKVYRFGEALFLIMSVFIALILLDIFKNNLFLFLGGLGIIGFLTGWASLVFSYYNRGVGYKIRKLAIAILFIFSLLYLMVDPEVIVIFSVYIALLIIYTVFLKFVEEYHLENENKKAQKYFKINRKLNIYILGTCLVLFGVWAYPFENNLNIYIGPNGEGLSSYESIDIQPKLSIEVEGGFIYNISSDDRFTGLINIKLNNPNAIIEIVALDKETLRVNLLNYHEDSILLLNGKEQVIMIDQNAFEKSEANIEIISDVVKSNHDNSGNYYIDINAEKGEKYKLEIIKEFNEGKWVFYSISDLHGGINVAVPALRDFLSEKPDFIIANGDLVNHGNKSEYLIVGELFNAYSIPIYTTIGNHDVWGLGQKYYPSFFGPYYYSFVYNNATFIFIDSSSGIIGESQFSWLESELKKAKTTFTFIISHMSPIDTVKGKFDDAINFSPESNHSIHSKRESDKMLALCDKYGVDYLLAAHSHIHGAFVINNTSYITSGVLGGTASAINDIGYLKIEVDNDNVEVEFVDSSQYYNSGIFKQVQTIQVFLIPMLWGGSIRLLITLVVLIFNYILWANIRKKFIIVVGS